MRIAALSLLAISLSTVCLAAGHDVTRPVVGPSPLGGSLPMVATNGRTFLTLWYRPDQVFGAVADDKGNRISGGDIPVMPLNPSFGGYLAAALTAIGADYVLCWSDASGTYLTTLGDDLKIKQTVALAGVPPLASVSIATNGSLILLAGQTGNIFPPAQTVAYLVDRSGSLVRAPVDLNGVGRVSATWSGTDFVVTFAALSRPELFIERITPSDAKRIDLVTSLPWPVAAAAASDGQNLVVFWSTVPNGQTQTFGTAVVSTDGNVTMHSIESGSIGYATASMLWNGKNYVASIGNLLFTLGGDGLPVSTTTLDYSLSAIASIGDVIYGVGTKAPGANVLSTLVINASNANDRRAEFLSMTPAIQSNPAIASGGIDFMTVFGEQTATARSIVAAPVARASIASVDQPIHLADTTVAYAQPSIAHGASIYLAAWPDAHGIYARRITDQGVMLDGQPIKVSDDVIAADPQVVWNGEKFLVVWGAGSGIVDVTVSEDGSVSPRKLIIGNGFYQPHVAWNGKLFLIVFGVPGNCTILCPIFRTATLAIRVAADGTPLDATAATIEETTTGNLSVAQRATVASDGRDFLVALDSGGGPALVPVRTDGGSIEVGARRLAFEWPGAPYNDIRWSGHDYVLASTYFMWTRNVLSLTHLTAALQPYARFITTIQPQFATPALAVNAIGESAVVIPEQTSGSPVPRVRAYFDSDFVPAPLPPAAPTNVTAFGSPASFVMYWNIGPDAEGVIAEITRGPYVSTQFFPPAQRSQTFSDPILTSVTLRAVNAGGLSQAVGALLQTPPRRRVVR